jgi:hypothetical protein
MARLDEALAVQLRIIAEASAGGAPDGYFHEEAAECLLALERAAEARPHFARAHELLSADPWMREHEAPRLARLAQLAAYSSPPSSPSSSEPSSSNTSAS